LVRYAASSKAACRVTHELATTPGIKHKWLGVKFLVIRPGCNASNVTDKQHAAAAGKGLFRNSDHGTENTMPQLWNRTLPTWRPEEKWTFANWAPHVVVINLMTNDYVSCLVVQASMSVSFSPRSQHHTNVVHTAL